MRLHLIQLHAIGYKGDPTKGTLVASMPVKMSRSEIETEILYKLIRRRCWGEKYLPVDSIVSWIGSQVIKNGEQVKKAIEDLIKRGLLQSKKKGETISLNPSQKREIESQLKKHGY